MAAVIGFISACGGGGGGGGQTSTAATIPTAVSTAPPTGTSVAGAASAASPTAAALASATPSKSTATLQPVITVQPSATAQPAATATPIGVARQAFLGAFFRPVGAPPYGIFSSTSPGLAPLPYPVAGSANYCTQVAANGVSIETGNVVDATKLNDVLGLGVRWLRMQAPAFTDDLTHVFGPGQYAFGDLDSAQCRTLVEHGIRPVIGLEAGPVQYSTVLGQLPALTLTQYASAGDFGTWCGAVAAHERSAFPSVSQFSLPGNEVNTNPQLFPGGNAQIAAYSQSCYQAIKAANPSAFVYGFELNMSAGVNAAAFVQQMYALGCHVGTCYDGIAVHLTLRYPIPSSTTPCYPASGGDYSMQCIAAIQAAAQYAVHVIVSENVYTVPASVPDEATKALAVLAEFPTLAANTYVDGVSYANVDECALYPTGYYAGGCLINAAGAQLPAYGALAHLALTSYQ